MKTKLLIAIFAATFAVQAQADAISITTGTPGITGTPGGDNAINIGTGSTAISHIIGPHGANMYSTAIGSDAKSIDGGTAIGQTAEARMSAIALGNRSAAKSEGAVTIGYNTQIHESAWRSVVVGYSSDVNERSHASVVVGYSSAVYENAPYSTVLGSAAYVEAANSVAVGSSSQVKTGDIVNGEAAKFTGTTINDAREGVVSVGTSAARFGPNTKRRIINVQDGVKETDAVNVRQAQALETSLTNKINAITTGSGSLGSRMDALEGRMDNLNARLDNVSRTANDGAALALATAGLVAPPVGKSGLVVGTGFYRGSNALTVGYAYTGDSWGIKATGSAAGRGNFGGSLSGGIFW